jgi:hypothetical protein
MVLNKRHSNAGVYIGRPTKWGNPFVIGADGSRADVIAKFEAYLLANPALMQAARSELKGKDLVCWCAPLACHGDVLSRIAMTMASLSLEDEDNPEVADRLVTPESDAPCWDSDPMRVLENLELVAGINCLGLFID